MRCGGHAFMAEQGNAATLQVRPGYRRTGGHASRVLVDTLQETTTSWLYYAHEHHLGGVALAVGFRSVMRARDHALYDDRKMAGAWKYFSSTIGRRHMGQPRAVTSSGIHALWNTW